MVEKQRYSYSIVWHVWVRAGVSKSSIDSIEFYLLSPKNNQTHWIHSYSTIAAVLLLVAMRQFAAVVLLARHSNTVGEKSVNGTIFFSSIYFRFFFIQIHFLAPFRFIIIIIIYLSLWIILFEFSIIFIYFFPILWIRILRFRSKNYDY